MFSFERFAWAVRHLFWWIPGFRRAGRLRTRRDAFLYACLRFHPWDLPLLTVELILLVWSVREALNALHIAGTPWNLFSLVAAFFVADIVHRVYDLRARLRDLLPKAEDSRLDEIRSSSLSCFVSKAEKHFQLDEVRPTADEETLEFTVRKASLAGLQGQSYHWYAVQSDKVDGLLSQGSYQCVWESGSGTRKRIRQLLRKNERPVLDFLRHARSHALEAGKLFFNGQVLCMSRMAEDRGSLIIHVRPGRYFDGYLTNGVCTLVLTTEGDERPVADGRALFPIEIDGNDARLASLSAARMENVIGVSTIGFTADRKLWWWKQTTRAFESEGRVAPSGSGSCEITDWSTRHGDSLITSGMQRELREESNLKASDVCSTMVLGYFRWLGRGGKPEFVGLTKVKTNYSEVVPEGIEVDRPAWACERAAISTIDQLASQLDEVRAHAPPLSFPLDMNLRALQRLCIRDPDRLRHFLFGN
jgi:hypothetical protein